MNELKKILIKEGVKRSLFETSSTAEIANAFRCLLPYTEQSRVKKILKKYKHILSGTEDVLIYTYTYIQDIM